MADRPPLVEDNGRVPEAHERLLTDVIRGDAALFMRHDEVEASWRWVEPILEGWRVFGQRPLRYAAGTWRPSAAIALIERGGRSWQEADTRIERLAPVGPAGRRFRDGHDHFRLVGHG